MLPLIIGGALTGGAMLTNALDNYYNRSDARNAYNKMAEQAAATNAANEADIAAYRQFIENQYGQGASNYSDAVQNFLDSEVYKNNGFSYTDENGNPVTVESFYDPAANQRVAAAMDAINNAAASGGNRFSSDYINRAAGRQAAMASEEWEKAYQRLMQDRQQQMSEWSANSQNAWNNWNAQQGRLQNAVDIYGADRSALSQGISDATMAGLNNRTANLQTQANLLGAKLNATQGPSPVTQALNVGANFLGSYYGGK